MKTLIKNCQYFGEAKKFVKGHVLLDDKQVLEVFNTDAPVVADDVKVIDAQGQYLIPGYVDLQVNGGKNSFFNESKKKLLGSAFAASCINRSTV